VRKGRQNWGQSVDAWTDYSCHGCGRSVEPADAETVWSEYGQKRSEPAASASDDGFNWTGPYFWHSLCWDRRPAPAAPARERWERIASQPVRRERYRRP